MRWTGNVARMRAKKNTYMIFMVKPEGRRPVKRPRRWWVDSIKMDLRGNGWIGMDWIDLAQDRIMWTAILNTVMNLQVP
jgi:hypothetical protein